MLQGHPEYAADSLFREYRRDMRLYLSRPGAALPAVPAGYVDAPVADRLRDLPARLTGLPLDEALGIVDAIVGDLPAPRWRSPAVTLFGEWLGRLALGAECPPHSTVFGSAAAWWNAEGALHPTESFAQ